MNCPSGGRCPSNEDWFGYVPGVNCPSGRGYPSGGIWPGSICCSNGAPRSCCPCGGIRPCSLPDSPDCSCGGLICEKQEPIFSPVSLDGIACPVFIFSNASSPRASFRQLSTSGGMARIDSLNFCWPSRIRPASSSETIPFSFAKLMQAS